MTSNLRDFLWKSAWGYDARK